ncbi:MAG TPA: hypothetical protein PLR99_05240 [Polyangiaceae bacterium]|nr:hypothetical protein [Polyangiaceae bacterium]
MTDDGMPRRPERTARFTRDNARAKTTRPEFRLQLDRRSTTLTRCPIAALGLVRTIAVLHGEGLQARGRIGYQTPGGQPCEGAIYLYADVAAAALEAIARHEAGEAVDVETGSCFPRPPVRIWTATDEGQRGICVRFGRAGKGPPVMPIHGRELRALVYALRAVVALRDREAA